MYGEVGGEIGKGGKGELVWSGGGWVEGGGKVLEDGLEGMGELEGKGKSVGKEFMGRSWGG